MNDTKLTELARAESPADPALRERVWARLQTAGAPVSAPAPRRWPRIAVAGALALASGVALVALRPGTTPLAPAVAFAEVERAMEQIQTATWEEKSSWDKTPNVYYLRQNPPAIAVRDNNGSLGTIVVDEYGHYSRGKDDSFWIWKRRSEIKKQIQTSLYFQDSAEKLSPSEDYLFKWRFSEWIRKSRDGFIEFQREGERYRDDTNWWKKQPHQKYTYAYLVDPKTNRIARFEIRQTQGAPGRHVTVRENYRYNVPLKPGVFDLRPKMGNVTNFMDVSQVEDRMRANRQIDLSPRDLAAIRETLKKLAIAYTQRDWNAYLALRDTTSTKMGFVPASTPEPVLRESFRKRSDGRSWAEFTVKSAVYSSSFQAIRKSESEPFPPANPKDCVEMIATIRGTDAAGKPLSRPARLYLRKRERAWRVSSIQFLPGKPRRAETPRQAFEKGARATLSSQGKNSRKQGF